MYLWQLFCSSVVQVIYSRVSGQCSHTTAYWGPIVSGNTVNHIMLQWYQCSIFKDKTMLRTNVELVRGFIKQL